MVAVVIPVSSCPICVCLFVCSFVRFQYRCGQYFSQNGSGYFFSAVLVNWLLDLQQFVSPLCCREQLHLQSIIYCVFGESSWEGTVWLACSHVDNVMFGLQGEGGIAAHTALSYCWMWRRVLSESACLLTYLLTYFHTYCMEQSPAWEANWFSASSQEILRILWNRKFITAFTSARHLSLYWATSIQSIPSHPTS